MEEQIIDFEKGMIKIRKLITNYLESTDVSPEMTIWKIEKILKDYSFNPRKEILEKLGDDDETTN